MESVIDRKKTSFIDDARQFNPAWRVWMILLSVVNLVGPLFFLGHPEAWATLACYFIAGVVMVPIYRRLGWVRLLGLGHFQWFILLPWLYFRLITGSAGGAFYVWLWAVIVIDTLCLAIDIVDVARYAAGEREPIVPRNR